MASSVYLCSDLNVRSSPLVERMAAAKFLCTEAERVRTYVWPSYSVDHSLMLTTHHDLLLYESMFYCHSFCVQVWRAVVEAGEDLHCYGAPAKAHSPNLESSRQLKPHGVDCLVSARTQHAVGVYAMNTIEADHPPASREALVWAQVCNGICVFRAISAPHCLPLYISFTVCVSFTLCLSHSVPDSLCASLTRVSLALYISAGPPLVCIHHCTRGPTSFTITPTLLSAGMSHQTVWSPLLWKHISTQSATS